MKLADRIEQAIHAPRMISPEHVHGTLCGQGGPFTRSMVGVTCKLCLEIHELRAQEAGE